MQLPDYVSTYRAHLSQLVRDHGRDRAMELVVGGQYQETGVLESSALISLGLAAGHTLVDVGCGSGRLPYQLRRHLKGKYIGTDLLDEALAYARQKCERPDWEFIVNHQPTIPVSEATADFVTFFSVFTHLLDEDIYKFLQEAKRVIKPGGKIVFSFLDFDCESHWSIFLKTVEDRNPQRVLNKFVTKNTVRRWARGVGLRIETIHDGLHKWVPILDPIICENGQSLEGTVEFGQSVAVLGLFPEAEYLDRYPDVKTAVEAGDFLSAAHHYDACGFREGRLL